ncbi:MAG: phenylacetate--CoA ligase family protein [Phycisphaerae bacterium]|nr:phenylacetate--CoA ligase family protein [Phycisphaerae bacterium]
MHRICTAPVSHFIAKRLVSPFWLRKRWLNKTQWMSADELSDLQFTLLKRMIRYAERNVPYYRELMKNGGFSSEDMCSLADINVFPILTKKDVLKAGNDLLSQAFPKALLRRERTGGTTGTPLSVYRNYCSIGNEHAFVRRQWDWARVHVKDRCAYLRARIIAEPDAPKQKMCRYDPLLRELHLSTYHLKPDTVPEYIDIMKRYRIAALAGYPSAVSLLARVCLARRLSCPLKAVLTSSEALTAPAREEISNAFACPVYDFYGSVERVCYIFTCEHGRYHMQPEYGYTELIPVNGSEDDRCRVVSTGFWNKAMPLIRYDTGDLVIKGNGPCPCGRAFPVIRAVVGREGDIIKAPSGEEFGATLMITLLHVACRASNILETQFIQDAPGHLTVAYVPGENFSADAFRAARTKFAAHLPKDINVDFERVHAISRTLRGKMRPVISLLPTETMQNDVPDLTSRRSEALRSAVEVQGATSHATMGMSL